VPFFISEANENVSARIFKIMHKIGRLLSGCFLILVFIASVTFSYFNNVPVVISYGTFQFPSQPVSVWIIGAFVLGGALGLLLGNALVCLLQEGVNGRRASPSDVLVRGGKKGVD